MTLQSYIFNLKNLKCSHRSENTSHADIMGLGGKIYSMLNKAAMPNFSFFIKRVGGHGRLGMTTSYIAPFTEQPTFLGKSLLHVHLI